MWSRWFVREVFSLARKWSTLPLITHISKCWGKCFLVVKTFLMRSVSYAMDPTEELVSCLRGWDHGNISVCHVNFPQEQKKPVLHQKEQSYQWDDQHVTYVAFNLTSALNPEDKGLAPACGTELAPEGINLLITSMWTERSLPRNSPATVLHVTNCLV